MLHSRRSFLKFGAAGTLSSGLVARREAWAQVPTPPRARSVQTPVLNIGFEESGDAQGFPIILLHGFPDDVRAWDQVAAPLASKGYRVIVPYLRGYGPTRFREPSAPRMAEQAAIGQDVIDLADAAGLSRFAVAGYDWGGRAACIAAALHPERVRAAVFIGGYTIQDTLAAAAAGCTREGTSPLVSVVLQYRTWARRARAQSPWHLPVALGNMVADVAFHGRDVQQDGDVIRQSRFRRRRDSFVPSSQPQRAGRATLCRSGTSTG